MYIAVLKSTEGGVPPLNMGVGAAGPQLIFGLGGGSNVDFDKIEEKYGARGREQAERAANLARLARVGAGLYGGFNALYNATSSGQAGGLLGSTAMGAYGGYTGAQPIEGWMAERGARHGAKQEAKEREEQHLASPTGRAGISEQDALAAQTMLPDYSRQMHFNPKPAFTPPPATPWVPPALPAPPIPLTPENSRDASLWDYEAGLQTPQGQALMDWAATQGQAQGQQGVANQGIIDELNRRNAQGG